MAQSLTQVGSTLTVPGTSSKVTLWILPAPLSGAGTLTINNATAVSTTAYGQLYTGMSQVSSLDSQGASFNVSSSTSAMSGSTTTVANLSLPLYFEFSTRGDDADGSGTTTNGTQFPSCQTASGTSLRIFVGTSTKTPAGSVTLSSTNGNARSAIGQVVSFAPNGTIAFNSEYNTGDHGTSSTVITKSLTLPAGLSNSMLVIEIGTDGAAPSSVTWLGTAPAATGKFFFAAAR